MKRIADRMNSEPLKINLKASMAERMESLQTEMKITAKMKSLGSTRTIRIILMRNTGPIATLETRMTLNSSSRLQARRKA